MLDWLENYMPDEMPPEWMWVFDDLLEEWFDEVGAARRAGRTFNDSEDE